MKEDVIRYISDNNQTIVFAAKELARYLAKQTGSEWKTEKSDNYDKNTGGLWLGLSEDVPLETIAVQDPLFDDTISAEIVNGEGIISGSNPRSVLICVYRVLYENGCRWIRPGNDGEIIPKRPVSDLNCSIYDKPSYRHRGVCIEGAVSFDHVKNMIDWLPKVGMNAYFFQFRESFIFFDRWYSHRDNPLLQSGQFTVEKAHNMMSLLVEEVKLRGFIYHAVGHGWTCEPFGLPGLGWDKYNGYIPPEASAAFAEIDNKKELFHGIPLDTNLCYSQKWVRDRINNEVIEYIISHSEIDFLHLWLADGRNNHCECLECSLNNPADLYIMLLNELDEKLTLNGLSTNIVFLVYEDLYWPAKHHKINNTDRFTLMFAPITRTYSQCFSANTEVPPMESYIRNKLEVPVSIGENLSYLRGWQKEFSGDSFDYDYHLIWDHYMDPGYMDISRGLACDIRSLDGVGLNGFISCQVQRAFFPTGLAMYTLGRSLWNRNVEDEQIISEYFEASFGPDWENARSYLEEISKLFDPVYIRGEKEESIEDSIRHLSAIPGVLDGFAEYIKKKSVESAYNAINKSWSLLQYHARICRSFSQYLLSEIEGNSKEIEERLNHLKNEVWNLEPDIHNVFDGWMFLHTLDRRKVLA